MKDLELDFARIQFYKPLASKLHPAGAFSLVKIAYLRILSMYSHILDGLVNIFEFGWILRVSILQALGQQAACHKGSVLSKNSIPENFEHM